MRRVPLQSVLHGTALLLGMDPSRDLNTARAAHLMEYINTRATEGWRYDFWPEWTVCEQRTFRDAYFAGNFVEPGLELYHTGSGNYYQALREQLAATEAPATFNAGVWTENSAWWAVCRQSYTAADWAAGTAFTVGQQTRNPDHNLFYQCHTAHTAGAAFDATQFGGLTAFDRYIAYEQTGRTPMDAVKSVNRRNPRTSPDNPGRLNFVPSNRGIQVQSVAPNVVWVEFRERPPVFTSTPWRTGHAYDQGDLVYYNGDTFLSLLGDNDAAVDGISNWARVPFPAILAGYVKRAAFSDALSDQKQQDRKRLELGLAQDELADALDRELDAQGQYERATVQTYGG